MIVRHQTGFKVAVWASSLLWAAVILTGFWLIFDSALSPINSQLASLSNQVQALSARLPQK
jgi:hypothetical protein